ncbi:MAG: hypothetical protein H7A25_23835 [Leptospiraceae bacterium]|nr:hypothetical protein [Leptospiraceae bacterium]MCP5502953.1 hypothetical protein [Leptospiraceae bacterium]
MQEEINSELTRAIDKLKKLPEENQRQVIEFIDFLSLINIPSQSEENS